MAPLWTWLKQLLLAACASHFESWATAAALRAPLCRSCKPKVVEHWLRNPLSVLLSAPASDVMG